MFYTLLTSFNNLVLIILFSLSDTMLIGDLTADDEEAVDLGIYFCK
jgi:hypothetical protein